MKGLKDNNIATTGIVRVTHDTVTASSLTSDDTLNLVPDLASDAIQLQPWFPLVVTIGFTILFLTLAESKLHYSNTQASTRNLDFYSYRASLGTW